MFLYLLTQNENNGYDTYDSCVVAAENEYDAVRINPSDSLEWNDDTQAWHWAHGDKKKCEWSCGDWAWHPDKVECKLIGGALLGAKKGVVLASFNAG